MLLQLSPLCGSALMFNFCSVALFRINVSVILFIKCIQDKQQRLPMLGLPQCGLPVRVCLCVCQREPQTEMHVCFGPDSLLFPANRGLGLSAACAPTEPALLCAVHTPAIRQAAKQTDEVNRETFPRVFWDVTATDATLTPTLDTVWQPTVSTQPAPLWLILKQEGEVCGGWHCAHDHTQDNVCQQQQRCHYVEDTKTDNRGWFHGAVVLIVQSSKDFQMWGERRSQFFEVQALICSMHDSIFEVNYGHYILQGQNSIT